MIVFFEEFLGMIREVCGANDNPDPLLFIQVYRLLSVYSLIKPPKGSNVNGIELFETIVTAGDKNLNSPKVKVSEMLDLLLENGFCHVENVDSSRKEHIYDVAYSSNEVVNYVAGFVSKKIQKWTSCNDCILSATKEKSDNLEHEKMIEILNKGCLNYPSNDLYNLIKNIEETVMEFVSKEILNMDTFFQILSNLNISKCQMIGCHEHNNLFTKKQFIISFL